MEAAAFSLNGVSFTYPTATAPAIDIHALSFEAGSFTVICGASGSGRAPGGRSCAARPWKTD